MSDTVGGITELQLLEAEVQLLKKKLELTKSAEETSACCARIIGSVNSAQAKDGFLVTEGSAPNQFHTSAGNPGEKGCCVVS
mmetsp:Transcript_127322/g.179703  ORF Transcript_127322/g.179703 Transcript_127322/m.179703 type:complete len:82 (-) Transcript_127322:62-307(-)